MEKVSYIQNTSAKYCMTESTFLAIDYLAITAGVLTPEEEAYITSPRTQLEINQRLLQTVIDKKDCWVMIQLVVALHASGQSHVCQFFKRGKQLFVEYQ